MTEVDLELGDGRTLHVYDTGADRTDGRLAVFWHHGTPNIGAPPDPLFLAAARLGIRWVSYDRPGYGGSTPYPDRDVASAAPDVAAVADALATTTRNSSVSRGPLLRGCDPERRNTRAEARCLGPSYCPYSPKCLEKLFGNSG